MLIPRSEVADLYVREAPCLKRNLLRKLGDIHQAEDVMQDAYVRILSINENHQSLDSPKAFLLTVASNLAIDHIRREQRARRIFMSMPDRLWTTTTSEALTFDVADQGPTIEDQIDSAMRLSKVMTAISELPDKCRLAFVLHKVMEHSHAEVARMLEITVSMVEKHVSKALKKLRLNDEVIAA